MTSPTSATRALPCIPLFGELFRPAAMWVAALNFALAMSVLSWPRPTRCRQCSSRPRDKLIGFVEQPLRRAPKGEVDGAALLLVAVGRKRLGFLEGRPVVVINPGG